MKENAGFAIITVRNFGGYVMIFISSAVCIALAVWTLSIFSKCKNAKKAKDAVGVLLVMTLGGLVGLIATTICAAVVIMKLDDPATAGSAYITFLAISGLWRV